MIAAEASPDAERPGPHSPADPSSSLHDHRQHDGTSRSLEQGLGPLTMRGRSLPARLRDEQPERRRLLMSIQALVTEDTRRCALELVDEGWHHRDALIAVIELWCELLDDARCDAVGIVHRDIAERAAA